MQVVPLLWMGLAVTVWVMAPWSSATSEQRQKLCNKTLGQNDSLTKECESAALVYDADDPALEPAFYLLCCLGVLGQFPVNPTNYSVYLDWSLVMFTFHNAITYNVSQTIASFVRDCHVYDHNLTLSDFSHYNSSSSCPTTN